MIGIFDTCHNNENYDENPEIRKRYWMDQGMQLKQHLKTTTRAFKCINQIRKWLSFDFVKLCWHFFRKIWKCKILIKIQKSGKYIDESRYGIETHVIDSNKRFQMHGSNQKIHFILVFKNILTFSHEIKKCEILIKSGDSENILNMYVFSHLSICSTSSRAVTRLAVYRASHIPDLAQVELAHTQNIVG